jgi:hypothetical protein
MAFERHEVPHPGVVDQGGDPAHKPVPDKDIAAALGGVAKATDKPKKSPAEVAAEEKAQAAKTSKRINKLLGG